MNYTVLQIRGGTKEEHLSGNGTGFIGEPREVTVDTTEWTLRVHDGTTVGGIALSKVGHIQNASSIIFDDGESLQFKFDNGKLGVNPPVDPPIPPVTNTPPNILTVSVSNALSNGSCVVTYYVEDKEQTTFTHQVSKDNGTNFKNTTPEGNNPYTIKLSGLTVGSNICAIKVFDGELYNTKYFIVEIPNQTQDTAPVIFDLYTSDITSNGFKLHYKAKDNENHSIRNHNVSLNNGYSYTEVYPNVSNGEYVVDINNLNLGTTYFCRLKIMANGLESNPYGFQVTTLATS